MDGTDPIILDRLIRRKAWSAGCRSRVAALAAADHPNLHDATIAALELGCLALSECEPLSVRHRTDLEAMESVLALLPRQA